MVQVLKGNIVQAPALGELQITEQGYLVLEDGVIRAKKNCRDIRP